MTAREVLEPMHKQIPAIPVRCLKDGEISEFLGVLFDKCYRSLCRFSIERIFSFSIIDSNLRGRTAFNTLPDMGDFGNRRIELSCLSVARCIRPFINSPPCIIPMVVRKTSYFGADVPFPV